MAASSSMAAVSAPEMLFLTKPFCGQISLSRTPAMVCVYCVQGLSNFARKQYQQTIFTYTIRIENQAIEGKVLKHSKRFVLTYNNPGIIRA